jgi:hypothetical protein
MIHRVNTVLLACVLGLVGWAVKNPVIIRTQVSTMESRPNSTSTEVLQSRIRCAELGRQFYKDDITKRMGWVVYDPEYTYNQNLNTCVLICEYSTLLPERRPVDNWHGQIVIDILTDRWLVNNRMPISESTWTAEDKANDKQYRYVRSLLLDDPSQVQGVKELMNTRKQLEKTITQTQQSK